MYLKAENFSPTVKKIQFVAFWVVTQCSGVLWNSDILPHLQPGRSLLEYWINTSLSVSFLIR